MPTQDYSDPVARLLSAGDPGPWEEWPDYPAVYGLTLQDVPELIRMASDETTFELYADEDISVWRNVHAWRALGQLGAAQAAEALVGLLRWVDEHDNDWALDDLPLALARLGPASLAPLAAYLADPQRKLYGRLAAINGLEWLPEEHPASRDGCVAAFMAVLARFAENEPELNAFMIDGLVGLKAVEAAPLVEQAFQSGRVDKTIRGDWEDFQVDVGLLPERLTEPEFGWLRPDPELTEKSEKEFLRAFRQGEKKAKDKRKQEKKSRKQNRKKKKK